MGTWNPPELDLWRLWKLATETVRARILEEVNASSGLSDTELAVLFRVAENTGRGVKQHDLAASMRWHRSRLSHQLTRMERRGLLLRERAAGGVTVQLTNEGRKALDAARPIFVAAVRRHFVDLIPKDHEQSFRTVLGHLVNREM